MCSRLLLLTALLIAPQALAGVTVEVPGDRPTLASALNLAGPGDTIHLGVGTFILPAGLHLDVPVVGSGPGTVLVVNGTLTTMVDVQPGEQTALAGLTLDAHGTRAVVCDGGSLSLTDVVLNNGGPDADGFGGGLARFVDCDVVLQRVRFADTSVAVPGGLIQAVDSDVTIVDSTFVGGQGSAGGALHVTGGSLRLVDTVVSGSTGATGNGGGLYADGVEVLAMGTTWQANRAEDGAGGAVWGVDGSYRSVGETFTGNTATREAGALQAWRTELHITAADLSGNASDGAGGVRYRGPGSLLIEDSRFVGNSGANGGGLAVEQTDGGRFVRNRFCGNLAQGTGLRGNGGGLNATPSFGGALFGENNLFVANEADDGGGMYSTGGTFVHETYVRNRATRGAAIAIVLGAVEIRDSVFLDNEDGDVLQSIFAAPPTTTFSLFSDNDEEPHFSLDGSNLEDTEPELVDDESTLCDATSFSPASNSPLIDAASDLDADGTAADIGAFGGPGLTDADGDGVVESVDCDDLDPAVGRPSAWFVDDDGDGYGRQVAEIGCGGLALATLGGDCDDGDPLRHPGADDIGNGLDDDCDLLIDEDGTSWFVDHDGDGFGDADEMLFQAAQPTGYVANAEDCDDDDLAVNPGAIEVCGGVDEDCDGLVDDLDPSVQGQASWPRDDDRDGFGAMSAVVLGCVQPAASANSADDCDDNDAQVNPAGVEVCDTDGLIDEDCDGLVDDLDPDVIGQLTFFVDFDGDGYAGTAALACVRPADAEDTPSDCDDADSAISPDAVERCDAADRDEDCNGLADDLDPGVTGQSTRYGDLDGDGFGDVNAPFTTCEDAGVLDGTDCDDADPSLGPPALRFPDADGDGYGDSSAPAVLSCSGVLDGTDCDDADRSVNPGAVEVWYDGTDQDCDGADDDQDRDGVVQADDCDDTDPTVFPGAVDIPDDDIDQDCDDVDAVYVYSNGAGCASASARAPGVLAGLLHRRR